MIDYQCLERIHILLGADVWTKIATLKVVSVEKNFLILRTTLGWNLLGSIHDPTTVSSNLFISVTCSTEIANVWKLETMDIPDPVEWIVQGEKDKQVIIFLEFF